MPSMEPRSSPPNNAAASSPCVSCTGSSHITGKLGSAVATTARSMSVMTGLALSPMPLSAFAAFTRSQRSGCVSRRTSTGSAAGSLR